MLRNDKIGHIAIGGYADLLILDADPLADITVLDRPEDHLFAIIKGGRVISSRLEGLQADILF